MGIHGGETLAPTTSVVFRKRSWRLAWQYTPESIPYQRKVYLNSYLGAVGRIVDSLRSASHGEKNLANFRLIDEMGCHKREDVEQILWQDKHPTLLERARVKGFASEGYNTQLSI